MSFEQLDTNFIDLTPTADGGFEAFQDVRPTPTAPIVPYTPPVDPKDLNFLPETPPVSSAPRNWTPQDYADLGNDAFDRPIATPDPVSGRPRWNPDLDFSPEELRRADDLLDAVPNNRAARRGLGRVVGQVTNAIPIVDDVVAAGGIGFGVGNFIYEDVLGRPWGPSLGDYWASFTDAGAPTGTIQRFGDAPFQGGQCVGVKYNFYIRYDYPPYGPQERFYPGWYGPIVGWRIVDTGGTSPSLQFGTHTSTGGQPQSTVRWANVTNNADRFLNIRIEDVVRVDGQADNCGNPQGAPVDTTIGTDSPTTTGSPPSNLNPEQPTPPDTPQWPEDTDPPERDEPEVPELPEIPELPESEPPSEPPDAPTPDPDCCPSTERSLDAIKTALQKILQRLEGSGEGTFDIKPCDYEELPFGTVPDPDVETTEAEYSGEGLAGIYSAISAIEASLNTIHSNTKCPPETTAALPMVWSAKTGEIEQLVILWKPAEGGGSRWAMSVPHPRASISNDFEFSFPTYRKGRNMATMRLRDNSSVIVNVFSRQDAQDVLSYVRSLIDPQYLTEEDLSFVYSENVSTNRELDVVATYAKKFAGHKDTAPLWAVEIN